jgi:hypothetical protein
MIHRINSSTISHYGLITSFILTISALLTVYIRTLFYKLDYPFNTFLSPPDSRFGDLYSAYAQWNEVGFSGVGYAFSYFPGMYLLMNFFGEFCMFFDIPGIWGLLFVLFTTLLMTCLIILKNRDLSISLSLILIMTFSMPSLLIWSTGNLEGLIAALILLSFVFFAKENYYVFSILIGIAASGKLFPAIFILALLFKVKYNIFFKNFLLFSFTFILMTFLSILFLKGGVLQSSNSFLEILKFSNESRTIYANLMYFSEASIPYGHSFLNGIHSIFGMEFLNTKDNMYVVAGLLSILIFIPSLIIAYKNSAKDWVFILILGTWTLSVVPTSTDYRLVYLWPALIMFFKLRFHSIAHSLIIMWVIVILTPKPYFPTEIHPQAYFQVYFSAFSLVLIPIVLAAIEIYSSRKSTSSPLNMR